MIRSWSRAVGAVQARRMMAAVGSALHGVMLPLDTQMFVNGRLVDQRTVKQSDGVTTLGFQRFRFVTQS